MIRVVHPGSGSQIRILILYPSWIRIQGSKRHRITDPDPQHCFLGIFFSCRVAAEERVLVVVLGIWIPRSFQWYGQPVPPRLEFMKVQFP
jgi:hypothetical protein